jgi:hypothetical protein
MRRVLLALLLGGVVALGAIDLFVVSGPPSTPAASGGSTGSTLAAQTLGITPSGCYVPGDLIGDANPATIRCASASEP